MAILTVKNRYREPYIGVFDGQTYVIEDTLTVPDYVAYHLKRKSVCKDNPVDPGANVYRLAILEKGDDDSPLDEIPVEAMDRTDMNEFQKVKIVGSGARPGRPERRERFGTITTKDA